MFSKFYCSFDCRMEMLQSNFRLWPSMPVSMHCVQRFFASRIILWRRTRPRGVYQNRILNIDRRVHKRRTQPREGWEFGIKIKTCHFLFLVFLCFLCSNAFLYRCYFFLLKVHEIQHMLAASSSCKQVWNSLCFSFISNSSWYSYGHWRWCAVTKFWTIIIIASSGSITKGIVENVMENYFSIWY